MASDVIPQFDQHRLLLEKASKKALRRLGPFLALMFAVSIVDRANVAFAKQALKVDVGIGDAAFALGAGIFFIGYALFEVPSNLILHKVGAKIWLSRIMLTWGVASASMMFVRGDRSFYALRFLVGLAEAGFSPGVVLYCTYWFTSQFRARALGMYYMGLPAALIVGSAISGALMQFMNGYCGLRNWQWMFLIEGMAACIVGIVAFFFLDSRPRQATWLSEDEQNVLELERAAESSHVVHHYSFSVFTAAAILRLVAIYFTIQVGAYAAIFYLPSQMAMMMGTEINASVGIVVTIPWLCALIALGIITAHADATGAHRLYALLLLSRPTAAIPSSTLAKTPVALLATLCIAAVGLVVVQPLFWKLATAHMEENAAASGIAFIGSVGNLGGFVAPTLKTAAERAFDSRSAGMLVISCVAIVGVLLLCRLDRSFVKSPVYDQGRGN